MKKFLLVLILSFTAKAVISQEASKNDTIYKINKEMVICKIFHIADAEIIYSFPGESLTNSVSKKLIKEIHFSSGRIQTFSEKIIIKGEDDWEKVQLTNIESDIIGLIKKGEVKGYGNPPFVTAKSARRKAEEHIKRAAAKLGCHTIFILSENTPVVGSIMIAGIGYSY